MHVHDYFLKMANIDCKIKKITMENHEFLDFQLLFVEPFIWHLIQTQIQVNSTMHFQHKIIFDLISYEIRDFLDWF